MSIPSYIIDFDSTLIRSETLEELARLALISRSDRDSVMAKVQSITDQGMAGTLPFDKSLEKRLRLFGAKRDLLPRIIEELKQDITPSVLSHLDWFHRNRDRIYVLSGAFEECVVPVVAMLGIYDDHVLANAFQYATDGTIIGYEKERYVGQPGGKVRQVAALHLPRPVVVIGDGYTDYEIRKYGAADEFWAFTENVSRPSVVKLADRVLTSFDQVVEVGQAS